MRLKTFKAPDLSSALAMAREQMGPGARVLATNQIRGRLGLAQVEITVGVDRPFEMPAENRLRRLSSEVKSVQAAPDGSGANSNDSRQPIAPPANVATSQVPPALRSTVDALVDIGLSADLTMRFARIAGESLASRRDAGQLAAAVEKGVAGLVPFTKPPFRSNVLFLVGPPGSGKTTTAAKFAARVVLRSSRRVLLALADTDRVGSLEQAGIYARHIGAGIAQIETPDDLAEVLARREDDCQVIVDTAGVGSSDSARLDRLTELRRVAPDAAVALLIPAGLHHEEVRRVIERFAPVEPTCAALTKVDDGRRIGDLLSALATQELPLAFMTNGHRVPDDLADASPRGLATLMLRSAQRADRGMELHR